MKAQLLVTLPTSLSTVSAANELWISRSKLLAGTFTSLDLVLLEGAVESLRVLVEAQQKAAPPVDFPATYY